MIPFAINGVAVDCINYAATTYKIPAAIILSVIKKEGGKNGQEVLNKNGTYDLGVLQVNEVWLPTIAPYGYTREDLQFNACKNILVGTWIIAMNLAKNVPPWQSIAN